MFAYIFLAALVLIFVFKNQATKKKCRKIQIELESVSDELRSFKASFDAQGKNESIWRDLNNRLLSQNEKLNGDINSLRLQLSEKDKLHLVNTKEERQDAVNKARSILKGKITEEITPLLPDFPYQFGDARFFGAPLDFIIFDGMSDGQVKEIIFLDVKTGEARLNQAQRQIQKCVLDQKVKFVTFKPNIPNIST